MSEIVEIIVVVFKQQRTMRGVNRMDNFPSYEEQPTEETSCQLL